MQEKYTVFPVCSILTCLILQRNFKSLNHIFSTMKCLYKWAVLSLIPIHLHLGEVCDVPGMWS